MKTIKIFTLVALSVAIFASCGPKKEVLTNPDGTPLSVITSAEIDSVSYAIGVAFGNMIKQSDFGELDYSIIHKAMKATISDKKLKIDEQKAGGIIQSFISKRANITSAENIVKGKKFLEENLKNNKDSVKVTESGIQYIVRNAGSEVKALNDEDTVQVEYVGTTIEGVEFDSSKGSPNPIKFALNQVIPGWREGIKLIGEGGNIKLFIPAELGYGSQQVSAQIKPNSTLIFEVKLVKVSPALNLEPKATGLESTATVAKK